MMIFHSKKEYLNYRIRKIEEKNLKTGFLDQKWFDLVEERDGNKSWLKPIYIPSALIFGLDIIYENNSQKRLT